MELQEEDATAEDLSPSQSEREDVTPEQGISMYVSAFEEMLDIVLAHESYLFTETELATFTRYKALSYNARYLLIRLLLRIPKIHRLDHITNSYSGELGPHIPATMDELCIPFEPPSSTTPATPTVAAAGPSTFKVPALPTNSTNDVEIIDLTEDEDSGDHSPVGALRDSLKSNSSPGVTATSPATPSTSKARGKARASTQAYTAPKPLSAEIVAALSLESKELVLTHFCATGDAADEEKLLRCLRMDELRDVAKAMKVWRNGLTYDNLVQVLLKTATSQSILSFPVVPSSRTPSSSLVIPKSSFATPIGKGLVRSNSTPGSVGMKQSKLSFGGTPLSTKTDGRARLAQNVRKVAGKTMLINEDVRLLWKRVNLIFYRSTVTPPALLLPMILTRTNKRVYPDYTPTRTLSLFPTRQALITYEQALLLETEVDDALGEQETLNGRRPFSKAFGVQGGDGAAAAAGGGGGGGSGFGFGNTMGRREGAEVVKGIWELVWDRWKDLVKEAKATGGEGKGARVVADRFTPGHVLTRIVYKGATALGVLHEYEAECEVLRTLLDQKVWRRGRRGAWYERLALIYMTHYKGDDATEKKELALDVCMDGLEDEDTHLIYRPSLARRLARLEKQLKIPLKECHRCEGELKTCETVTLVAKRIRKQPPPDEETDDVEEGGDEEEGPRRRSMSRSMRDKTEEGEPKKKTTWGVKSAWLGRDDTQVGVEQWVLEQWEAKGWRGFHSEGSILTTVFGLLFWDILFAPVPGAFETAFQSAPLDLGEDTFALARAPLVAAHLGRIEAGEAPDILREVDERERDKETWCVGVRWYYERADLLEIVECLGGRSLSIICRMLCEEYGHRSSGVPDLIVWNHELKKARFVEVKGPGDTLSSTQKIWIDVMLSAGIEVEVCRVAEEDPPPTARAAAKSRSTSVTPLKRSRSSSAAASAAATPETTTTPTGGSRGGRRKSSRLSVGRGKEEEEIGVEEEEKTGEEGEESVQRKGKKQSSVKGRTKAIDTSREKGKENEHIHTSVRGDDVEDDDDDIICLD